MKLYKLINGIAETALEDMEISGITDNTSKVREGFISYALEALRLTVIVRRKECLKRRRVSRSGI